MHQALHICIPSATVLGKKMKCHPHQPEFVYLFQGFPKPWELVCSPKTSLVNSSEGYRDWTNTQLKYPTSLLALDRSKLNGRGRREEDHSDHHYPTPPLPPNCLCCRKNWMCWILSSTIYSCVSPRPVLYRPVWIKALQSHQRREKRRDTGYKEEKIE